MIAGIISRREITAGWMTKVASNVFHAVSDFFSHMLPNFHLIGGLKYNGKHFATSFVVTGGADPASLLPDFPEEGQIYTTPIVSTAGELGVMVESRKQGRRIGFELMVKKQGANFFKVIDKNHSMKMFSGRSGKRGRPRWYERENIHFTPELMEKLKNTYISDEGSMWPVDEQTGEFSVYVQKKFGVKTPEELNSKMEEMGVKTIGEYKRKIKKLRKQGVL